MTTATNRDGNLSDAALACLFMDNTVPTQPDILAACKDAQAYCDVAHRLIGLHGITSGLYIREQKIFGPLVRLMAIEGWTLSGSGYFSVAFHKGGLALKIGLRPQDDLSLTYLHWCTENGDLPGVPMLYALGEQPRAYAAVMDRYEGIAAQVDPQSPLYDQDMYNEYEQVRMAVEHGYSGGSTVSHTGAFIHREFSGKGVFDITEHNVMIDRKGNMVITDPIAGTDYTLSERNTYSQAL